MIEQPLSLPLPSPLSSLNIIQRKRKFGETGFAMEENDLPMPIDDDDGDDCKETDSEEECEDEKIEVKDEKIDIKGENPKEPQESQETKHPTCKRRRMTRRQSAQQRYQQKTNFINTIETTNDIETLNKMIDAKTEEYNNLRKSAESAICFDLNLLKTKDEFKRLSLEMETIRERISKLSNSMGIYGDKMKPIPKIMDCIMKNMNNPNVIGQRKRNFGEGVSNGRNYTCKTFKELFDESNSTNIQQSQQIFDINGCIVIQGGDYGDGNSDNIKAISDFDRKIKPSKKSDEHTVLDLLKSKQHASKSTIKSSSSTDMHHILNPLDVRKQICRKDLLSSSNEICSHCGGLYIIDTKNALYVCENCGFINKDANPNDMLVYTEIKGGNGKNGNSTCEPLSGATTYKPSNHFDEIKAQLQGKRKARPPIYIQKICRDYCIRYRIKRKDIDEKTIRECLKRYRNGNQLYKYAMEISCILKGVPPPCMTSEQESILSYLYPRAVHAYKTSDIYIKRMENRVGRIKKTPNNQTGNYVLYKLCELCGFDGFLPYIRLSSDRECIRVNDETWKHVCNVNKWKYMETKFYGEK
jgi:hypothetical protein